MAGTYTAWNGKDYPWPPPTNWQLRADGRYWPPQDSAPAAGPQPSPQATTLVDQQAGSPIPAGTHPAVQGAATGTPYYNPGGSGKGCLIAILIAALLLVFAFVTSIFTIRNAEDDFQVFEEVEVPAETVPFDAGSLSPDEIDRIITIDSCRTIDGIPTAQGTVLNDSNGLRTYSITMEFSDESGQLLDGFVDVDGRPGQETDFRSRSPQAATGQGLECKVGSVFRFGG